MDIGYKLRNLRRIKNLTQEELAERTDLSKGYKIGRASCRERV